ncbi:outer membrane immunogenic protein [Novosphingobium sp. PhB55]|uniref:outer membrane protein n=1 Tax=Novosphingobium sp. PhB55 TaxID=2485106 RepID=UPI001065E659|nr:outer membrane beta-barrel protein [Novosphingobium sp. PhB55]TDW59257.1 outer membrane immunogenic protein [Novosphingobium sp. PhB55]
MKKHIAAATLALIASPAFAQDVTTASGVKAGVVVGYDSTNLSYDDLDESKGGFLYGATLGYDYDTGPVVVGVEGEITGATTNQSYDNLLFADDRWKLSAGRDLYVGARIGFHVFPSVLLYAKGGYTNSRANLSIRYEGEKYKDHDNLDGFRLGAGAEVAVTQSTFARIEYRYSDYGNYGHDDVDSGIGVSRHQVALISGLRFKAGQLI